MRAFRSQLRAVLLASTVWGALALPAAAETVLYKGNGGEPQTLDPAHTSINVERFVLADLDEGLTVYDAYGKVIPGAAESWTISPDATVYTFKIRDNAKWSNGEPVTAEDFAFTLGRVVDPKEASGYANILYPIKNAEAINTGKLPLDQLGVKAIDAKTLQITLERPTPYLLELLTHNAVLPVNKKLVEQYKTDFVKPGTLVSNGAYMLTENVANDHITMVKNPNYWDAANVKIDKVVSYPTEDNAAQVRRFMAGEFDVNYNFQADQLKFLREKLGDQVHVSQSLSTYYYVFDVRKPPFDDVRVREALSMAVDRDFLSEKIYNGAQLPTYSIVPEGIHGYTPAKFDYADMSQLDREDKAVELLKEAGYGKGGKPLKIEIRYNTNENHKKVATAIADMWKAVGADVSILNSDVKTHYAYIQDGGSYDAARVGWVADYADPENFLFLLASNTKSLNWSHYSNPAYDDLMAKSYAERDPEKRMQILHDAEALGLKDGAMAPLMTFADFWLVSNKIKGWHDNAVNSHLTRFLSKE
ncbi:peptide ABC transporter substrate-binding protein [Methylovirgula sp. 4M-Z18]|uniref:peptide ABC transporter substrate-binding protein n=1 Tax=Methylovirgula sp. 4M-Z18 TaxID=2293567 RepID=UPI000E2EFFAC|nr:peptide ABC transporter substrate-binding protein [Methylovirgula sp. 4M-Z18]RFB81472.1 peptide ABC transporter substrate-binding protein [Methylovirgula sp. 4M-Z18]